MDRKSIHKAIQRKFGLHRRGEDNLPWVSLRKYTRNHLAELLGEIGFNVGAEIGVRKGRYSTILCKNNPRLKLYCIDPWNNYHPSYTNERQEKIYQEALKNLKGFNVEIIRETSMDAIKKFDDNTLDFVFIDGNHTFDFCCVDIIYWSKKVKENGIVSVHDYYGFKWAGVRQAVDAYTHAHHIDPWYVTKELEPTAFWPRQKFKIGAA
jgi:predicted O-methyltransferase YrrM